MSPQNSPEAALSPVEQAAALKKISYRLIPLLFLCYVIAYIDRINVGFAKLDPDFITALGVDPTIFNTVFGTGAGIFFIGYFIFEVPSNLILHRVGARIWIARIMILWGLISMAFMFLKGKNMFYTMRFLLGAAEAGFFPGVLLYFTYWYPTRERAKIIALFAIGGVTAGVLGSPISGALLKLDGLFNLQGWQWVFILEGLPAVLIGIYVLFALPNRPRDTRWLSEREKNWIEGRVAADAAQHTETQGHGLAQVFTSGRVYLFCLIYFLMNVGSYGYEMWAPTIVKQLSGGSPEKVGFINAIPYLVAGIMMYVIGRNSDRTGERRFHIALSAFSAAIGFAIAAKSQNPYLAMTGLVIAFAGLKCTIAPFWALTTTFLTGTAAAGGIALINSVGNLGGYFGPDIVGKLKDKTGSDIAALLLLGGCLLGMSILTLTVRKTAKANSAANAVTQPTASS